MSPSPIAWGEKTTHERNRSFLVVSIGALSLLLLGSRVLFVARRLDLVVSWQEALIGLAVGAAQDMGLSLALGGLLSLTALRWPRFASASAVILCLGLAALAGVGTEYFAWSSHRLDLVFLAYLSQWRALSGSVSAEVSRGFLAAHAALGLGCAWLVGHRSSSRTAPRARGSWTMSVAGASLLGLLWWTHPGDRTWFASMAGGAPMVEVPRPPPARGPRRLASEERPADAVATLRAFSNPFQAKHFTRGVSPYIHFGGFAPEGTWQRPVPRPNVIVVLMEGMEAGNLAAAGGRAGLTPRMDELAGQGLFFSHFFSNGTHTPRALDAVLCSVYPRLLGLTTSLSQPELPLRCLPSILSERGYRTSFVHGGHIAFENRRSYLPHIGFEELHFLEQFGVGTEESNAGWGTNDEVTYGQALRWIDAQETNHPFFLTVLSISNHHPFLVPDASFEKDHDRAHLSHNTVRYADFEVGRFVDELRKRGLLENSYVFILGDHGLNRTGGGDEPPAVLGEQVLRRTHVPLIVLGPGIPRRNLSTLASQVDIMPTVLDLLAIDPSNHALGQSLGWALQGKDLPVFVHDVYSEMAATIEPGRLELYPLDDAAWARLTAAGQSESTRWRDEGGHLAVEPAPQEAGAAERVRRIVAAVDNAYAAQRWWGMTTTAAQ